MISRHIESSANQRINATARLKQRSHRDETGLFLVEGTREVERAVAAGATIAEVYLCPDYATSETQLLGEAIASSGVPLTTTSTRAFDKLSNRRHPDGIAAIAATWRLSPDDLSPELTLVAESIEKPGNLGAMLRTVDAAGAGLLLADPNVDPFNPNVVRASQGAVFSAPFAVANAGEARAWALNRGSVFVATPDAVTEIWHADLTGVTALVIGSEHAGVSKVWNETGTAVRIPMTGEADSLNASVTAAVLLFEAVRQRRT
ncbi:MAG: RNA methyltransferase [Acidimicrobiia bacterium]